MNYRWFASIRGREYVDDEDTCFEQHQKNAPPMFHIKAGPAFTAHTVRCPRSLTPEERAKLKGEK